MKFSINDIKIEIDGEIASVKIDEKSVYDAIDNDSLFLLSIEEYEEYKYAIPDISCWWWLRSPGGDSRRASFVSNTGNTHSHGDIVGDISIGVRPALRESSNFKIGERIIKYEFSWIHIGDGIYIAEVPIAFRRFDKESNNYYTSEIRKWINETWINKRS